MAPRVLFVSKPVVPPFHDGAKCLVRNVAGNLASARATVLATRDAPDVAPGVALARIYPGAGSFAPALADNARVLAYLLAGPRPNLWHFVFAPNPASSLAGRVAKALRRVPTVQTVASAPRSFEGVARLLFGNRVVALSEWTRARLVAGGADASRVVVIPPPCAPVATPGDDEKRATRAALGLPAEGALVVYPGDLEMSAGARVTAAATPAILAACPDATVVFACRKKTERAHAAEAALRASLASHGERVRFVGEVPSLPALLACARVVAFPVDDLYGKVDLPIALLEAMALGVPVVVANGGPLPELGAALVLERLDADALARAVARLASDDAEHADLSARGRATVAVRFAPRAIAARYEEVYESVLRGR